MVSMERVFPVPAPGKANKKETRLRKARRGKLESRNRLKGRSRLMIQVVVAYVANDIEAVENKAWFNVSRLPSQSTSSFAELQLVT